LYKNENNTNWTEDVFREFENLRNHNKELMMYLSVVARMIKASDRGAIDNLKNEDDQRIATVLLTAQDREDLKLLKDQSIRNEYVRN